MTNLAHSSTEACLTEALADALAQVRHKDRLAALRGLGILDTRPEPEFDDIVTIATALCETPVALISLVDETRQWFKARIGFEPEETTLDRSICAHALAHPTPLIIPDLTRDARTRHNPLVVEAPHFRFYAGAPLIAPLGHIVGSLCVIDRAARPGGLSPRQIAGLTALARQVMVLLEARRVQELQNSALTAERRANKANLRRALATNAQSRIRNESALRLKAAQEAGQIGIFEIDLVTDIVHCSEQLCRIYGLPVQSSYPTTLLESCTLEEDRALGSTRQSRQQGEADPVVELRIRRVSDGAIRWIVRRGQYIPDEAGEPAIFIGTVSDITERKTTELRQRTLLQLGDDLRQATTVRAVQRIATTTLGEALNASRVAYCTVDRNAESFHVRLDWTAPRFESIVGTYPLPSFAHTIARLQREGLLHIANIHTESWMEDELTIYLGINALAQIAIPMTSRGDFEELLVVHSALPREWTSEEIAFARALADRAHFALARLRAEEAQRVLNEELSHRLKNTLAMVQAIASQTLRNAAEPEAVESFRSRIAALSTAHDILLQRNWESARISVVVQGTMKLHAETPRVTTQGDDINLSPKAVLSLTLLLHELATNALKYGALSTPHGHVEIRWVINYLSDAKVFSLYWWERGGPAVQEPTRRGFGSRLMRMGLAGTGDVTLTFGPAGLRAEFRAPLADIIEA